MNIADLLPSVREVIFMILGVFLGAFLLIIAALMSAAGSMDDHDERTRGIRRS